MTIPLSAFASMPALVLPGPSTSAREPVKKALCIGIGYSKLAGQWPDENPSLDLGGTHNDPIMIRDLLIGKYGYREEDITILMDDDDHTEPTHDNIMRAMEELVRDAQSGDHFVFAFSGHGSQVPNLDETEDDHLDEVIWPSDVIYKPTVDESDDDESGDETGLPTVENYIMDDDLKRILVDGLPPGARLAAILDCCHSGTGIDLPHTLMDHSCDNLWSPDTPGEVEEDQTSTKVRAKGRSQLSMPFMARGVITDPGKPWCSSAIQLKEPKPRDIPSTQGPLVTSWSACLDDQVGIENQKGGTLVRAFVSVLKKKTDLTHAQLLHELNVAIYKKARKAKPFFKAHKIPLVCPKPQLGCLGNLDDILDMPFTF